MNTSKHLVFLCPELLTIGGIQRYCRATVVALDRYAHQSAGTLSVISLNDTAPAQLPARFGSLQATSFYYCGGRQRAMVRRLGARLPEADVVLYGLLGFVPLVGVQQMLHSRSLRVLMLYGLDAWEYRGWLHAWGVRQMTSYVSISQHTLDRFRRVYTLSHTRPAAVIPNPISPGFLDSAEHANEPASPSPRLLSVTRLVETDRYKGVDTVIRTLPRLRKEFPDIVYTVIGDGSDRPRLEALAHEQSVQDKVRFLGHVSEETLLDEFARCTLYVMPSEKEGFGFVFIEAMAFGKPVVAARAGATPEVVEHGKTGLLIEYDNVPQLQAAISRLLHEHTLRNAMGHAGRDVVGSRYTADAFNHRWANVLDTLSA